jgi:hypothetical protein
VADAAVGELRADEPREGAELLDELRTQADDVATQEAGGVDEVTRVTEQVLRPHREHLADLLEMKSWAWAMPSSKRRCVPTWSVSPEASTSALSASHSWTVTPIGFSTRTCLPAAMALEAIATWNWSAIATMTASTSGSASIWS